jgi:hypothetical protein
MIRKNPNVDIVKDILEMSITAYPASNFLKSLLFQYLERGGLSKKQLQDLHVKALKVADIPAGKLATLEAMILKKPTRYKSPLPVAAPAIEKDLLTGQRISEILEKYPQHKMVLFLKMKYENSEILPPTETAEVVRLHKLLVLKIK